MQTHLYKYKITPGIVEKGKKQGLQLAHLNPSLLSETVWNTRLKFGPW